MKPLDWFLVFTFSAPSAARQNGAKSGVPMLTGIGGSNGEVPRTGELEKSSDACQPPTLVLSRGQLVTC